MPQQPPPVWLITGCSTGFGKELAKLVIDRGNRVVITARNPDRLQELAAGHEATVLPLALDVTQPEQIHAAVQQAHQKFGGIDVLVNNAGYGYLAAVEEGEDAPVRAMFETNFFGLVNLTNAVLPGMRARRSGRIVNISSIGGLVSFGATGYYHATKYAVEGVSESLSIELAPLGIRVILVEPGPFRTDWSGRSLIESGTVIPDYDATAGERRRATRRNAGKQVGDPIRGSQAIIDAVESPDPPLRLLLGKPALDLAYKKLDALRQDFDAWRDLTLSADFPESRDPK